MEVGHFHELSSRSAHGTVSSFSYALPILGSKIIGTGILSIGHMEPLSNGNNIRFLPETASPAGYNFTRREMKQSFV